MVFQRRLSVLGSVNPLSLSCLGTRCLKDGADDKEETDMDQHAPARMRRHLSDSLLSAAENCLHHKSHLDVTSREIAASAGTYAGMVNYYFNNKDGLFSTLIDTVVAAADRGMRQIEEAVDAGAEDPTQLIVGGLYAMYEPHPAAFPIVFTEIFRHESEIRKHYAKGGGSHSFDRLERVLKTLVTRGHYRRDLDTRAATWMILSLVISPRLLEPVQRAMGDSTEMPEAERWLGEVTAAMRAYLQ